MKEIRAFFAFQFTAAGVALLVIFAQWRMLAPQREAATAASEILIKFRGAYGKSSDSNKDDIVKKSIEFLTKENAILEESIAASGRDLRDLLLLVVVMNLASALYAVQRYRAISCAPKRTTAPSSASTKTT
jgi:hypothetical protein